MSHIRRPRRAWAPTARTAAAIIATASVALPAAAFGSGQSTNTQKALAYSRCMRSHGVLNFPDPDSSGLIPKVSLQQLEVSGARFQAAQTACRRLLPLSNQPGPPTQTELREAWNDTLKFAHCMRSHGTRNWPDPARDSESPDRPAFYLPVGIDLNSPQTTTKLRRCEPLLHGWSPYIHSAATGQTNLPGT